MDKLVFFETIFKIDHKLYAWQAEGRRYFQRICGTNFPPNEDLSLLAATEFSLGLRDLKSAIEEKKKVPNVKNAIVRATMGIIAWTKMYNFSVEEIYGKYSKHKIMSHIWRNDENGELLCDFFNDTKDENEIIKLVKVYFDIANEKVPTDPREHSLYHRDWASEIAAICLAGIIEVCNRRNIDLKDIANKIYQI